MNMTFHSLRGRLAEQGYPAFARLSVIVPITASVVLCNLLLLPNAALIAYDGHTVPAYTAVAAILFLLNAVPIVLARTVRLSKSAAAGLMILAYFLTTLCLLAALCGLCIGGSFSQQMAASASQDPFGMYESVTASAEPQYSTAAILSAVLTALLPWLTSLLLFSMYVYRSAVRRAGKTAPDGTVVVDVNPDELVRVEELADYT